MTASVGRRVALAVAVLFALVAALSVLAAASLSCDSSEARFEPGQSIDWQLAALSVAPGADTTDTSSALALGAVRFRVEIPSAAPCALLIARPAREVRSSARDRPSRARAPPRLSRVS